MKNAIENEFLQSNSKILRKELLWRIDNRLEWLCKHGIGHTIYHPMGSDFVHGCDGCCKKINIPFKKDDCNNLDG